MKTRRAARRHSRKGGGYGFGGSILSDAGGSNAGNAQWNNDTGKDCGAVASRGGNNLFGGRRRRRSSKKGGMMTNAQLASRGGQNTTGGRRRKTIRRRKHRGGAYVDLAQQAPRTGYTFTGQGVAGTADTVAY